MSKCIFKCGKPLKADEAIEVELNIARDGTFHASSRDPQFSHRENGVAHKSCYSDWYAETYGVKFDE